MAIPESPIWSSETDIGDYAFASLVTAKPVPYISAISLGPAALNDSNNSLIDASWVVYQINGKVLISKSL